MRLDVDETTTSLTPCQVELLEFFQPKGDSDKLGKEVCHITGVQSFARVMEIGSMSRHIYESETKEGKAQEQDIGGQRLQWRNPESFEGPAEEKDHLKAVLCKLQGIVMIQSELVTAYGLHHGPGNLGSR